MKKIKLGQAGKPIGLFGKFFGLIMSITNRKEIEATINLLEITLDDKVLEIGFGPGKSFKTISLLTTRKIYGIDHSEEMVKMASYNNNKLLFKDRLELQVASASNLPFQNSYFNKIFSINCIYFWDEPVIILKHIKNKLTSNGIMAVTVRNSKHGLNINYNEKTLKKLFEEAGFVNISIDKTQKHIIAIGKNM